MWCNIYAQNAGCWVEVRLIPGCLLALKRSLTGISAVFRVLHVFTLNYKKFHRKNQFVGTPILRPAYAASINGNFFDLSSAKWTLIKSRGQNIPKVCADQSEAIVSVDKWHIKGDG